MNSLATKDVEIPTGSAALKGILQLPANAKALVIFAHGSGSDRHSPRNRLVAELCHEAGYGTLLFDLLTEKEKEDYRTNVFDIGLLTGRLAEAVAWTQQDQRTAGLKLALIGASTGAAAALNVAAELQDGIAAVVSRGGRPDLADQTRVADITAPTSLIIGGDDAEVIELSRPPYSRLPAAKELVLIPGATHVFDEPGTLEQAGAATLRWLKKHLV